MNSSDAALKELFKTIWTLVDEDNFTAINKMFQDNQPAKQTPLEMIALLRYAYSIRHNLPEYHIYLDAVALELRLRGLDVERMLAGLPIYSIDRYP